MTVYSEKYGLTGRTDTVSPGADSSVWVTEYKATPVRKVPQITEAMVVQLALQGLCLKEAGLTVAGYSVYFTDNHKTVDIDIDDDDVARALDYVSQTRDICASPTAPQPLEDDAKCTRCSHVGVCLPDERKLENVTRRITVSDPDGQVLHLATPGSRASISKGRVLVKKGGETLGDVPVERIQGVTVHGNVDLSGALIRELLWRDITVVWCSGTGRVYGWSQPADGPNGAARVRQHVASAQGRLDIAREFIAGKIAGQATFLRRNTAVEAGTGAFSRLRELQKSAETCTSTSAVFGVEGEAAALYFQEFPSMFHGTSADFFTSGWSGRHGRGATDPLNAALNYSYALLTAETVKALVACGLDPHAGFLHSSGRNKPALALDLMEEFRASISDSTIVTCINRGMLTEKGFSSVTGTPRLTPDGRKAIIGAFERRMSTEITHPIFGYKATWRRVLEIQARLVLGCLDGTQDRYRAVRTR
jgi:CRISPR-associated protein Cas1